MRLCSQALAWQCTLLAYGRCAMTIARGTSHAVRQRGRVLIIEGSEHWDFRMCTAASSTRAPHTSFASSIALVDILTVPARRNAVCGIRENYAQRLIMRALPLPCIQGAELKGGLKSLAHITAVLACLAWRGTTMQLESCSCYYV